MKILSDTTGAMPDVATQTAPRFGAALEWVGMDGIDAPVRFDAGDGVPQVAAAKIGAFVNLVRPDVRGIHMSRLYLTIDEHLGSRTLDAEMLDAMLQAFLDSHAGLADRARVDIRFQHLVRRRALRSDNSGWRAYPVTIEATRDARGFHLGLTTEVTYSSTCPASAALARQLIQERFATDFAVGSPLDRSAVLAWLGSEQGIVATLMRNVAWHACECATPQAPRRTSSACSMRSKGRSVRPCRPRSSARTNRLSHWPTAATSCSARMRRDGYSGYSTATRTWPASRSGWNTRRACMRMTPWLSRAIPGRRFPP